MKKLKRLLLFFVCGLVACAMAIPLAACTGGTGGSSQGDRVLQSINVDSFDAKVNFAIGDAFSYEGLTVTATYQVLGENITTATEDVTSKVEFDTSEFDSSKSGTYTVYLSYTYGTVTLFGDYDVNVVSDLEGTIAGLDVSYSGERQIDLSAENTTASIDLSKLKVVRMNGETVDDTAQTTLPEGNYTLAYSKDGGELISVAADATSISGLTNGVYSIYAYSTYTLGNETFEMSGFVTVYVVDTPVSLTKDEGGTLTYDYGTDVNTIGSDWKFTVKYASGATATLTAEDVEFGDMVSDKEGENVVAVSYTEDVFSYDSEADDAVATSVQLDCNVTYTIGENPNPDPGPSKLTDVEFNVNNLEIGDITANTNLTADGKISLMATSDKAVTVDANDKTYGGIDFNRRLKLNGKGSDTERSVKLLVEGDATIKVYALSGSGSEDRNLNLYDSEFKALITDQIAAGKPADGDLSELTYSVSAGTYYLASDKAVNIYYILIDYADSGSDTPAQAQTFIADFANASKGWSGVKNEKIPGTVYVAADGTVGTEKTDGVLSLISNDNAKYSSRDTAKSEDGSTSFSVSVQMGTIGSSKAWCVDLSDYSADTNVKISVYAATSSGDNVARKIGLYSSTSSSSLIEESRPLDNADIAYCVEWDVVGGNTFYIGSTKDAINYFKIVIEVGV